MKCTKKIIVNFKWNADYFELNFHWPLGVAFYTISKMEQIICSPSKSSYMIRLVAIAGNHFVMVVKCNLEYIVYCIHIHILHSHSIDLFIYFAADQKTTRWMLKIYLCDTLLKIFQIKRENTPRANDEWTIEKQVNKKTMHTYNIFRQNSSYWRLNPQLKHAEAWTLTSTSHRLGWF